MLYHKSNSAGFFCLFGERILTFLPKGSDYAAFWWAIPWIIAITSVNLFSGFYGTGEVSAFRFAYMKRMIPLNLLSAAPSPCLGRSQTKPNITMGWHIPNHNNIWNCEANMPLTRPQTI